MAGTDDGTAWMPLWIGDFLGGTQHMTAGETGAYVLLLMHAWGNEGRVPNDAGRLARIARMPAGEWARAWPAVRAKFRIDGDWLVNDRCAEESARVRERLSRRTRAGQAGAAARWDPGPDLFGGDAIALRSHCDRNGKPYPQTPIAPPDGGATRSRRKAGREMPADFGISPAVRAWALEHGFEQLEEHLAAFRVKCAAHGYRYVSWDAAFMQAIRANWAEVAGTAVVSPINPRWWASEATVLAEGKRLGLEPRPGESMVAFRGRIEVKQAGGAP